jgi:TonB-linked SusC/RagA family outer membrane protein
MYKKFTHFFSWQKSHLHKILLVMKLTTALLIIILTQVSAKTVAQKISLHFKEATLPTVFKEIGHQSGYDFFYDSDILLNTSTINIDVKNADIVDVLNKCLTNQQFTYSIENRVVVIRKKSQSLPDRIKNAFNFDRTITGKIVDEKGTPLPGATIKLKGSNTIAISDDKGSFQLTTTEKNITLLVSFVGYETQEVQVPEKSENLTIRLLYATSKLNEVKIMDSYGSQRNLSYTGAANVVSSEAFNNKPYTNPLQALQGQVPGLNIVSSTGQPGANIQVRLRGIGSIGLDANPLYVVDGLIINAGSLSRLTSQDKTSVLAGINLDDIESITVLKDASAAAIYGSRGANGVIIIATKKGKAGKAQVNLNIEIGSTNNLQKPAGGKPLNAADYSTLTVEGLLNSGISPTNTTNGIPFYVSSYGLFQPGTDWYKAITRNGSQAQYNVSVTTGTDKTRVFTSAGYFKQEATVIGSQLNRITGLVNVDQTISKRISLAANLHGSNVNQNIPLDGNQFASPVATAYYIRPTQNAYNPDGSLNTSTTGNTNFPSYYNPLYIAANDRNFARQSRLLANVTGKYNIWDNLNFTSNAGLDYTGIEENRYLNPIMGDGRSTSGSGADYYTRYANWTLRNQLDYKYDIPGIKDFFVTAAAGYEAQKSQGYFITAQSNNYPFNQPLLTASVNASTVIAGNSSFNAYTFNSFYSRGSVNYQSKYILTGSFRRDGSSRFGASNRSGNFWSVGAAWNIQQEQFFAKQHVFSSAKFRSSYGLLGNAGNGASNTSLGNYAAQPAVTYGSSYAGSPGQNFTTVGNTLLTWESSKAFDIGADLGLFEDRLIVSFDYYNRYIDGLIQSAPISRTTGFASAIQNVGAMRNRGEELSVTGIPISTSKFKWTTNFNLALNKNRVERLANHASYIYIFNFRVKEGSPYYTWSLPLYAGVDPANGEALWYTNASRTATTNAYNLASQRVDQKQADPKYFGGWSNTFTYQGFSLTGDFYYSGGNHIYDSSASILNDGTQYTYGKYAYNLNRWTTPGQITDVPRYVAGGGTLPDGATLSSSSSLSTRFLYKGDYIRLKNVTAGFDFKNISYFKKYGISKLYLYGRATNLWTKTFDKRLPFDPEVGITGVGVNSVDIPQVRTFTIGLNVGL